MAALMRRAVRAAAQVLSRASPRGQVGLHCPARALATVAGSAMAKALRTTFRAPGTLGMTSPLPNNL